jgi:hypothetical protein
VTAPPAPLPLRVAIVIVIVETLLTWAYVAYLGYESEGAGGWRVVGYFALYAIAFTGLSWALVRRRRWVRAPLIVLQLLLIAVGVGFVRADSLAFGVVLAAVAVGCVLLLVTPSTRAALGVRSTR